MRLLIQRASRAKCEVENRITGQIDAGLVVFVGFTENDTIETIQYLTKKLVNLRIFPDKDGLMNLSILDYGGSILSISQFTLYADCKKGNRPSFQQALKSSNAKILYEKFNEELRKYVEVQTGIFGSEMDISLTNAGPITILLER